MLANWSVRKKEFTTSDLRLDIKDGLHKKMRDELDYHPDEYCYLTYEGCCDLLFTIKVKDEMKIVAVYIKNIDSAMEASLSDSDESMRVPRRKISKTGVSNSHKSPRRAHYRHHGAQRYRLLCKKI